MYKTGGHPLTQNRRIIGRLINGTIQIENYISKDPESQDKLRKGLKFTYRKGLISQIYENTQTKNKLEIKILAIILAKILKSCCAKTGES